MWEQTLRIALLFMCTPFLITLQILVICMSTLLPPVSFFSFLYSLMFTNFSTIELKRFMQWKLYEELSEFNLTVCMSADVASIPYFCFYIMQDIPYSPPWNQASVCRYYVRIIF